MATVSSDSREPRILWIDSRSAWRAFSYFSAPYSVADFTQMLQLATTTPVWDEGIEVLAATQQWIRLLARCDLKTADRLLQFIHEIADLAQKEREAAGTAFRELLMNAIEHGARSTRASRSRLLIFEPGSRWLAG
jgi:hypothetical protein